MTFIDAADETLKTPKGPDSNPPVGFRWYFCPSNRLQITSSAL